MIHHTRRATRALSLLVGPALLLALGCSDDGLGKRYPVSGTVKYKGEPVNKARISFVPTKAGAPGASGEVVNGNFSSLTTLNPGDGVLPGDYTILVDQRVIDEEKARAETAKVAKEHGMEGVHMIPPELQAKAMENAKSAIPGKYQTVETSDLKATVDPGHTKFDFTLTDQ